MREERKVVTALFADLVGSTALAERLDAEEVRLVVGEAVARQPGSGLAFKHSPPASAGGSPSQSDSRGVRRSHATRPAADDVEGFRTGHHSDRG